MLISAIATIPDLSPREGKGASEIFISMTVTIPNLSPVSAGRKIFPSPRSGGSRRGEGGASRHPAIVAWFRFLFRGMPTPIASSPHHFPSIPLCVFGRPWPPLVVCPHPRPSPASGGRAHRDVHLGDGDPPQPFSHKRGREHQDVHFGDSDHPQAFLRKGGREYRDVHLNNGSHPRPAAVPRNSRGQNHSFLMATGFSPSPAPGEGWGGGAVQRHPRHL